MFATVTVLIGKLSADILAGHQIALTVASTTFMMPLGISSAAAVRVGHAIGRGDPEGASRSGWMALALWRERDVAGGAGAARLPACDRAPVHAGELRSSRLRFRCCAWPHSFSSSMDLQITATGALRGAGDTRTPMLCHFAGYWILGLPLGAFLCFHESLGAVGLWMGLSAGLIVIGLILLWVWRRKARGFRESAAVAGAEK